ncbi:MAG: hypothetical protein LBO04_08540 [Spirochaetaceae bacterium]|jgi:hypothetical protein|nr:hypothetical protein [Spirochaetaceae bacterium]
MNRKMNWALVLLAALAMVMGFTSCGKKDGGTASAEKIAGESFNLDLPLTYNVPTAAANMLGLPQLSAKSLFDEANFTNTTGERSLTVVCESQEAKDGTFTGVLLLSAAGKKALRMTISLRPDDDGEFLYITEVSLKNLESGEVSSMSYDGTQGSAANVAGMFVGLLELFYDKDKLLAS